MCSIKYMQDCTHAVEVLYNRVRIVNQALGCRYAYASCNPVTLCREDGRECVKVCGVVYAAWSRWDIGQIRLARVRLDSLFDAVWYMRRAGLFAGVCV